MEGESSNCDRYCKRLKVCSSIRNGMFYQFPQLHGSNAVPFNSSGEGNDERDGFGATKQENFEVSMDLTDDLLHLVFSFLDQIELCRAAIVCRQWQTASTHQDFWRFLNFENRNISEQQYFEKALGDSKRKSVMIKGMEAFRKNSIWEMVELHVNN